MKRNIGRSKGLSLLIVVLACVVFTSCGRVPTPSFQEQMEKQQAFEQQSQETETPQEKGEEENSKSAKDRAKKSMSRLKEKSEKDYDYIMEKFANGGKSDMNIAEQGLYYYYRFQELLKEYAAPICAVSIVAGIALFAVARGNKRLRKWAICSLSMGVPAIILLLIYCMGFINSFFL